MEHSYITTRELADFFKVQSTSILRALCVNGHYMKLKPTKLPNGKLLWPDRRKELLRGE